MSIRAIVAYVFSFAGLILTNYGLYKALQIGTCGVYQYSDLSTHQYINSPPCPEGTGTAILSLMAGFTLVSFGIVLFVLSFKKLNLENLGSLRQGILLGVVTWSLLFCTMAVTFVVGMGDSLAVFLAITFGLMGLAPLPFLPLLYKRFEGASARPRSFPLKSSVTGTPSSPSPAAPVATPKPHDKNTITKLAELNDLHNKGILTDLEFEQQKQKLLGRL